MNSDGSDFDKDDGMMKSLIRIAGLMVILALTVGAMTAFADAPPRQERYVTNIVDAPRQESTPEAAPEVTEAASVRETIREAAANQSAAQAESSSAFSTLLSIIVTAIVGAVVLAAAVAGAIYLGMKLVRRKGD